MPLMFNGEFGRLAIPHSIPPEKHRKGRRQEVCEKYTSSLMSTLSNTELMTKDQVIELAKSISKNDVTLTSAQVIAQIKSLFPNAVLPERRRFHSIVSTERSRDFSIGCSDGMIEVGGIKTLRHTDFGREI